MKLEIPSDLRSCMHSIPRELHYQGRSFTLEAFREHLRRRVTEGAISEERAERLFAAWKHSMKVSLIDRHLYFPEAFNASIDYARLPNRSAFNQVMTWFYYGNQNLVAFGDTGTGKTRSVYAMLSRLRNKTADSYLWKDKKGMSECDEDWCNYGVEWSSLIDIPATSLAAIVRKLSLRDPAKLSVFIEFLKEASILFIDDITQLRLTDRLAESLYDLMDCRYRECRSLIVTSQVGADGLVDKLAHGDKSLRITARAIVRRISQDGDALAVDFDAPTQPPGP